MSGPLSGFKIIEMAGIGPGPFCGMMLSDLGAEILRIDRADKVRPDAQPNKELLARGRKSVGVNLKTPEGVELVMRLLENADGLIEGYRPGVMERLGLGPEACLARSPRLVYGRMTGWGQDGPMAQAAGHDINYIALAGALEPIGRRGEAPVPPLNLVGDFGGGGMLLAYGMVCGMLETSRSGQGQVVDAAMVDGAASLMSIINGMRQIGFWQEERGTNLLDTGAFYYDVYECKDGKYISIGALEPQFYAIMLEKLELTADDFPNQHDREQWPAAKAKIAAIWKTRTRAEWCDIFEGSDACFAPVLSMSEAPDHPHMQARKTFVERDGLIQAAPSPRFSRTPGEIQGPPVNPGEHTREALQEWGISAEDIQDLESAKAIA
ncbi:MAG: CaiB/BaiF CoA-transferase family protein [Candidatus Binatia bacterium]|nr:CaiB/BaiF CoA-transferase family protein [Candidatus Binatia bacterium]MDG2008901.1 CaiB/BaiF CoA-transferase family protein [Candidatus Binatia bacterium]